MRIGLVVDSACDLPLQYLEQHDVTVLPITVRIGEAVLADHRDEQATLEFLHAHVAERGHEAQTMPYTVQQIQDLFLGKLVIDYDYVFCMTITKTRSPIFDNAQQAIAQLGALGTQSRATIVIDNYTTHLAQSDAWDTARLVRVVRKEAF